MTELDWAILAATAYLTTHCGVIAGSLSERRTEDLSNKQVNLGLFSLTVSVLSLYVAPVIFLIAIITYAYNKI